MPRVVGHPAHQFIREEQHDERDPVPQEQPAATQGDGRQPEGDRKHVGREADAALEHQPDDERAVAQQGDQQEPLVAPAQPVDPLGTDLCRD